MNIHDVSTYLTRFDEPIPPTLSLPGVEDYLEPAAEAPDEEPVTPVTLAEFQPPVEVDVLRRGFEEELATALEKQQATHEENMRQARAQWIEQEAELLRRRLSESVAAGFETLRADIALILAPFVAKEIEDKALEELKTAIRQAIADDQAPAIRLAGPKELIEKIANVFSSEDAAVSLIETDGMDISVDLAITKIETRFDAWMRRLCESRSCVHES